MRDEATAVEIRTHIRLWHGMRRPANWLQLVRFGLVGGMGFVINLAVYALCVHSLGIVSGGGAGDLETAIALGLDGFLTGEPSEPAMTTAREAGVHFIAAGHYATETFGVRCLGELLAERFEVAHEFIDVPNPV